MEYENMRVTDERRLRSYSRMRKGELVAFLKLFSTVRGEARALINLCDISICSWE